MSIGLAIALIGLTSVALAFLLVPLLLRRRADASREAYNLAVYRDPLADFTGSALCRARGRAETCREWRAASRSRRSRHQDRRASEGPSRGSDGLAIAGSNPGRPRTLRRSYRGLSPRRGPVGASRRYH